MTTTPAPIDRTVGPAVAVGAWTVIGILAILGGLGVLVTSVVGTSVAEVPVEVTSPATSGGVRPCAPQAAPLDTGECRPPDGWAQDQYLITMPIEGLALPVADEPSGTRLLARSPVWIGLVAGGLVVLLLVPVIRSTAQGHPFADGNAARLAAATGVVATAWGAATLTWFLAADLAITRLEGLGLPRGLGEGWVAPELRTVWWPLLVVAMLGTHAAATRRGAALAAETEGLV